MTPGPLSLRLPATSANLGPGFDTLALALDLHLEIDVCLAQDFAIEASGRNADLCSQLEGNLLLAVYRETVRVWAGREAPPLLLRMRNQIPLGMGCGSSAASRLAALALASHFGGLGWSRDRTLAEACRLEGHPDNAAACWLGGFVASCPIAAAPESSSATAPQPAPPVAAVSLRPPAAWTAILVMPEKPLPTATSRAVLPTHYSRQDAVWNLQRVAVLTAAVTAGRGDLLAAASLDRLHQPYRGAVCPLLPPLLPLAGREGILSVTLSGAGPAVLLLLDSGTSIESAKNRIFATLQPILLDQSGAVELLPCRLAMEPAAVDSQGSDDYRRSFAR